eukprot:1881719-Alexandrium_andersonii.AAC.1
MGAGVWAPDHHPDQFPAEARDFCWHEADDRGVRLWASPTGPFPSSARAEAFAVLLALQWEVPCAIALDASVVQGRLARLLDGQNGGKPWLLQRDGDAWAHIA